MGTIKEPLYVCVYVPEFPAQALSRLRHEISKAPVVVVEGDPPLEQVCSANTHAMRLGVAHGMSRAELDVFAGIVLLRRSKTEEWNARSVLLEAGGSFTPRMEIQHVAGPHFVMVLDMTGTARVFGSTAQVIEKISSVMSGLRFFVQLAASRNFHAAVSMAPAARITAVMIPSGQERRFLSPLPLAALNLNQHQAETLRLWGLHTFGDLTALPEVELVVRLGQEGKRLRALACGDHSHLMVPEEDVFRLEEQVAFDSPIEEIDSLLFMVGPMLDQLLVRALNRCYALAEITLKLGLDGGDSHERTIRPTLPVLEREIFLKLLYLDLQAHPPTAGVVSLFLQAKPGDRSKVQMGLFVPQMPEPMRLDVTLARIAALVGEERVGKAVLLDRHGNESFAMERFVVPQAAPKKPRLSDSPCSVAIRRCRPPLSLSVRQHGRQLTAFSFKSRLYTVEQAYGPWRSSGDWWAADVWSREEWDVQAVANLNAKPELNLNANPDRLLCVVSHDLLLDRWQMEAIYD